MERTQQSSRERELLKQTLVAVGGGLYDAQAVENEAALLADLGVDSMRFVTLIFDYEDALGRKVFTIDNLSKVRTLGDLFDVVDASPAPASAPGA